MKKVRVLSGLLAGLLILAAAGAQAAIQEVRVLGVGIGHSSEEAEKAAVDYARKRAVYLVALKLQVKDASDKVAALKPEQFARIVRGATVLHTRREEQTTYADVSVSVIDTELKRELGLPDAPPASTEAAEAMRSILVLPVLVTPQASYLWEKENTLREPVADEVLRQSHGAVAVPAGDFDDLRLIDHQNAASVTADELKPMFARYGAEEIVIALVAPGAEGTDASTKVTLRRLSAKGVRTEQMDVPVPDAAEKTDAREEAAASAIAGAVTQIAGATSQSEQQRAAAAQSLKIHFAYANPHELAQMEEAVRGADGVILLEIPSISLQDVDGTVHFTGGKEALRAALAKQAVIVVERGDGWVLSLR
ncbi:MAG: hypothetical protein WDN72_00685 [Alphaproteobacteria bacterium]